MDSAVAIIAHKFWTVTRGAGHVVADAVITIQVSNLGARNGYTDATFLSALTEDGTPQASPHELCVVLPRRDTTSYTAHHSTTTVWLATHQD